MSIANNISFFARVRVQLAFLLLLIFVPALILTIRASLNQQRIEKDKVREATVALANLCAAKQQTFVEKAKQLLVTVSQVQFLTQATDPSLARFHFANLCTLMPEYADFGLLETNGTVFASSAPLNSQPAILTNWGSYHLVLTTKKFAIGNVETNGVVLPPSLDLAYPVFDGQGNVSRILVACLRLEEIQKVIEPIRLPPDTTITLYDHKGMIIARFPGKDALSYETKNNRFRDLASMQRNLFEKQDEDGENKLFAIATITDAVSPALMVSVTVPTARSFAAANHLLWKNLAAMCGIFLAVLVVAYVYAERFFSRPLQALIQATRQLTSREPHAPAPLVITNNAELGELADRFNQMARTLEDRHKQLEQSHKQVQQLNADLEKRVEERTAELAAANRELERFSYSVSHDLRGPLRAMQSFAAILKEDFSGPLPPEALDYLDRIDRAAARLDCLTNDILQYSRVAAVQLPLQPVDLNSVVADVLRTYPNLSVADFDVQRLPTVRGQSSYLTQCFSNLIANAIKFVAPGTKPRVKIWAETKSDTVRIWIEDNGIGIAPEHKARIFEIFERLNPNQGFEGTGIGLAIVRAAVERMSGELGFESQLGKGSRFWIELAKVEPSEGSTSQA